MNRLKLFSERGVQFRDFNLSWAIFRAVGWPGFPPLPDHTKASFELSDLLVEYVGYCSVEVVDGFLEGFLEFVR